MGLIGLAAMLVVIRSGVQRYADEAVARFPGGRIEALMAVVDCEDCRMADRNHAVWALGQMTAEPALPLLKAHYDGGMIEQPRAIAGTVRRAIEKLHLRWR